jgi:hypothetical protein
MSYEAYAAWQRSAYDAETLRCLNEYWSHWHQGVTPVKHPVSGETLVQGAGEICIRAFKLSGDDFRRFRRGVTGLRSTVYNVVLAATMEAVSRWAGAPSISALSIGDMRTDGQLRQTVGLFICLDPLRLDFESGSGFYERLQSLNAARLIALRLRRPPGSDDCPRVASINEWIPILANGLVGMPERGGWSVNGISVASPRKVNRLDVRRPISIEVREAPGGLTCSIDFRTRFFDEGAQRAVFDHLIATLQHCIGSDQQPGEGGRSP